MKLPAMMAPKRLVGCCRISGLISRARNPHASCAHDGAPAPAACAYQPRLNVTPLREALAAYLGAAVRCTTDQVIIVAGIQQALDLVARMTLDPGDEV
ncbi:MAG: hypothetical protein DMG58_34730 [Acidobacteria bacterium]|nr:MAG: hypothetical protein DMG58_34730 [Acidobacteriota bacterium]